MKTRIAVPFHTFATFSLIALGSCTQQLPPGGERPAVSQREVGARVSRSLCEHDQQCGRVGPGSTFESVDACAAATSAQVADDVDANDCQDGAWISRVEACENAISAAGCDGEVDPSLIAACNEDRMCLQPPGRGVRKPDDSDGPFRRWKSDR
jgi:hypothetical protein